MISSRGTADFASRTTPVARAPFGIAIFPSISIGEETVAEKFWPVSEVFELSGSSRTTVIVVSAGTTSGFGVKASRIEDLSEDERLFGAPGAPLGELLDAESGVAD